MPTARNTMPKISAKDRVLILFSPLFPLLLKQPLEATGI